MEYKVLHLAATDLETTFNLYAQDGFRVEHLLAIGADGKILTVLCRKQKVAKKHHEVFDDEDD